MAAAAGPARLVRCGQKDELYRAGLRSGAGTALRGLAGNACGGLDPPRALPGVPGSAGTAGPSALRPRLWMGGRRGRWGSWLVREEFPGTGSDEHRFGVK